MKIIVEIIGWGIYVITWTDGQDRAIMSTHVKTKF